MWQKLKDVHTKDIIAVISIVGVVGLLVLLQLKPIPEPNKDVVNIAIGALLGGLIARIAGHYFPSTSNPKVDRTGATPDPNNA